MKMANPITDEILMGSFEEKRALVRSFTLFDDTFFSMVMEDKASCEEVLRIFTGIEDLVVKEVKTQYSIRNLGTHSVVLDVLAEDSSHRLFNIEVQTANEGNHQKRIRYYQSNIDISYLDKGKPYEELPEVYLIYLTPFDIFKRGKTRYEVTQIIQDTDIIIDDGVHRLFINAANSDQTVISALMQFFSGTASSDQQFPMLSRRVRYFKEEQEGVEYMCEAVERYAKEREARGRAEEKATMIRQVYKNGLPMDQIIQFFGLPETEVKKILAGTQN